MLESEKESEAKNILKKKLYRKKNIILNPLAFRPEYMPEDLFVRPEIDDLFDDVSDYINYNSPGNILILGRPGTGKTASLKFIEKTLNEFTEINESLFVRYVNCRNKSSSDILNELTGNIKINIHTTILLKEFFSNIKPKSIILLDEVDMAKDSQEMRNLLYTFSRPSESNYESKVNSTLKLVLASNNLNWFTKLDRATASSLLLKEHIFETYNIKQLMEILERRCKEGLASQNCVNKETLKNIAQKTVNEHNGDARYAIKVLFYAARESEREGVDKIASTHIEKVYEYAEKDLEGEGLIKLNDSAFLILYSSLASLDKVTTKIYDFYCDLVSNFRLKAVKYTNFHNYLEYLENQNLIRLFKDPENKTKVLSIETVIPKETLEEEYKRRKVRLTVNDRESSSFNSLLL